MLALSTGCVYQCLDFGLFVAPRNSLCPDEGQSSRQGRHFWLYVRASSIQSRCTKTACHISYHAYSRASSLSQGEAETFTMIKPSSLTQQPICLSIIAAVRHLLQGQPAGHEHCCPEHGTAPHSPRVCNSAALGRRYPWSEHWKL